MLMFGLGVQELLIIFAIILVIFGASKLPQLGRGLGEGIRNFKVGLKDDGQDTLDEGGSEKSEKTQ
jgi:sec-independent protein translocase protein TatA